MKRLLIVLFALLLSACGTTRLDQKPKVSLAGLELQEIGLFEQRFLVTLRVTNPNDDSVTIDGVEFKLELNDQHFASGVGKERITLPRMGDALVKLSVTTNLGSLWKQVRALQGGKPIGYRMTGKLYAPWLPGGIPFDRKGELPGLGEFLPEIEQPKTEKL
jgi:LEA14-like dessication related protein